MSKLHGLTGRQVQRIRRSVGVTETLQQTDAPRKLDRQIFQRMFEAKDDIQPGRLGDCYFLQGEFRAEVDYMGDWNRVVDEEASDATNTVYLETQVWNPTRGVIEKGDEIPAQWTTTPGSGGAWVAQVSIEAPAATLLIKATTGNQLPDDTSKYEVFIEGVSYEPADHPFPYYDVGLWTHATSGYYINPTADVWLMGPVNSDGEYEIVGVDCQFLVEPEDYEPLPS